MPLRPATKLTRSSTSELGITVLGDRCLFLGGAVDENAQYVRLEAACISAVWVAGAQQDEVDAVVTSISVMTLSLTVAATLTDVVRPPARPRSDRTAKQRSDERVGAR
jgi:hypothetical protein